MTTKKTESAETARSDSAPIESAAPASTSASTPALAAAPHPSAALVEEWFTKHFHNMSALFDERSYTHLLHAKEDLKVFLAQSL